MLDLGMPERAKQIAMTALENWERECRDSYNCYEHFMIESGRGGGWNNFSGLSSPIINWHSAYFKPGTISTGFGTLICDQAWNEDKDSFKATLEFDKELVGKETALIICAKPGVEYKVTYNGKSVPVSLNDGVIEIKVKATKVPSRLIMEK